MTASKGWQYLTTSKQIVTTTLPERTQYDIILKAKILRISENIFNDYHSEVTQKLSRCDSASKPWGLIRVGVVVVYLTNDKNYTREN